MEFNEQEVKQFIKLQRINKFERYGLFFAFICSIATLTSAMFASTHVTTFALGAIIPIGNILLMRNSKELIHMLQKVINSNANSLKRYSHLK